MGLANDKKEQEANERRNRYKGRQAQNDSEFVNLELSTEQVAQLRGSYTDYESFDSAFVDIVSDGSKVTLKWDDRGRCFVAFCFPPDDSDNAGFILTGRGGSASRALRQLLFKHFDILGGDWPAYHNRAPGSDEADW